MDRIDSFYEIGFMVCKVWFGGFLLIRKNKIMIIRKNKKVMKDKV